MEILKVTWSAFISPSVSFSQCVLTWLRDLLSLVPKKKSRLQSGGDSKYMADGECTDYTLKATNVKGNFAFENKERPGWIWVCRSPKVLKMLLHKDTEQIQVSPPGLLLENISQLQDNLSYFEQSLIQE